MDRKKTARIISMIFQPTFIPIILYLIVAIHFVQSLRGLYLALIGIGLIALAPIGWIYFLARYNKISDPDLPDRRERFLPYIGIVGLYVGCLILFIYLRAPRQVLAITVSYILVTLVGAFISLFWKVSMHLAGVAGPVTALVVLVSPYFALAYLFLIPLGWARYILKKHTLSQIIVGSGISIFITLFAIRLFS